MKKQEQGARGEALALDFLEFNGYSLIQSNFVRRVGEIDLVMRSPDSGYSPQCIVFVEVRYRASGRFGGALASIDWRKQRKMVRVANAWLQKYATSRDIARIDVVAIEPAASALRTGEIAWKNHHIRWLQNAVESAT